MRGVRVCSGKADMVRDRGQWCASQHALRDLALFLPHALVCNRASIFELNFVWHTGVGTGCSMYDMSDEMTRLWCATVKAAMAHVWAKV